MDSYKKALAATALLAVLTSSTNAQTSGSGTTTRYWDCCKPSCAWPSSSLTSPVKVCDVSDQPISDGSNTASGCTGGSAYMCSDQSPWAVSDSLAYGFAAVSASAPNCCSCYKLTFTSTAISGKTMIVQATNTGTDVGSTQFDLAIPGGGFGIFDGCSTEWKATSAVWGAQYGGPSTNTCSQFPTALQPGCGFRWDWMEGADNPTVDFETVDCPAEIVAKSGCSVTGSTPASGSSAVASSPPSSSAVAPASSSAVAPVSSNAATPAGSSSSAPVEAPTSSSSAVVPPPASSNVANQVSSSGASTTTSVMASYGSAGISMGTGLGGAAATNSTLAATSAKYGTVHYPHRHHHKHSSTIKATPSPEPEKKEADSHEQDDCEA